MILRRIGNKQAIAHKIIPHFPPHDVWIEPFFGAGGMFFNKPRAKYNFLNDLDGEVINCFDVLMKHKDELKDFVQMMPTCQRYWERAKVKPPENDVERAVFFLLFSNFGYMGKPETLHFSDVDSKAQILDGIERTYLELVKGSNKFSNQDFRKAINVNIKGHSHNAVLIYADPPYLNSTNNYSAGFKDEDSISLFEHLQRSTFNWAMSEFDDPFILQQAKERNLNVITVGERVTMKNRRTEILITNYPAAAPRLF